MVHLTKEQELLVSLALHHRSRGEGPYLTNDPIVNWTVDQRIDDFIPLYDEAVYLAEIEAQKKSGGLILGWIK